MRNDIVQLRIRFSDPERHSLDLGTLASVVSTFDHLVDAVAEAAGIGLVSKLLLTRARPGSLEVDLEPSEQAQKPQSNSSSETPKWAKALATTAQSAGILAAIWGVLLGPAGLVAQAHGGSKGSGYEDPYGGMGKTDYERLVGELVLNPGVLRALSQIEQTRPYAGIDDFDITYAGGPRFRFAPGGLRGDEGVLTNAAKQVADVSGAEFRRVTQATQNVVIEGSRAVAFPALVRNAKNHLEKAVVIWRVESDLPMPGELLVALRGRKVSHDVHHPWRGQDGKSGMTGSERVYVVDAADKLDE